jgi:hypothetical protein
MEAVCSSETLVPTYKSTRDNKPEAHHYSPESGGSMYLRNAGTHLQVHTDHKPEAHYYSLEDGGSIHPKRWYPPTNQKSTTKALKI